MNRMTDDDIVRLTAPVWDDPDIYATYRAIESEARKRAFAEAVEIVELECGDCADVIALTDAIEAHAKEE